MSIIESGSRIHKMSGPASVTVLHVQIPVSPGARPRSCVMYLMGDIHFSFDNMCPPSKCVPKKGCVDIGRFLHNVTSEPALRAISLETDVFMEVPFGDIMKKKKNQTKGDSSDPHIKDFGERAGILGWMYKHFSNRLYAHGRSSTRLGRFHFVDVRTNTGSTGMPSTTTDFLRSAPTVADAYKLMYRILMDDPVRSKVAKQFHKLKGSPYQLRLAEYIKTSVEHIINDIRKSYTHNTPAKKESSFDNIFFYKVRVLVMDTYLLGRMLYYMIRDTKQLHHRIVLYAGAMHTSNVTSFLVHNIGAAIVSDTPSTISGVNTHNLRNVNRCVNVVLDPIVEELVILGQNTQI